MTLPRRRPSTCTTRPSGQQPAKGLGGFLPYSVLIVDDSEIIRRLLRFCIEHTTEWQVIGEAENGSIAVAKVEELHPDIVILDFQMPVMNGIEAAQKIRLLAPKTAMVMFTMHNSEQLRGQAEAAGIKDVVSKSDRLADHLILSLKNVLGSTPNRPAA
jgi:DNA-binding NarL/FixJ family response regulator